MSKVSIIPDCACEWSCSRSLGYARKFVPIRCQPGNRLHFRLVQNQQHKDIIGDIPFALDSMLAGGSESESGIVVRVSHNNDKWAARILEFLVPRFDQFTPDSLALVFRKYCHRAQCGARNVATDRQRTVHDVT